MTMSNSNQSQDSDVSVMAEVANYGGGFPSNSSDVDWNWTRPVLTNESDTLYSSALSAGFHASVIVAMSFLIVAGMLLNLVSIVTHLRTVHTATDRNRLPATSGITVDQLQIVSPLNLV